MLIQALARHTMRLVRLSRQWGLDAAALFVYLLAWSPKLIALARVVRRADVVVVLLNAGFGHTITAPDLARRLFRGRRCAVLILSDPGYHNEKVARIWPDVDLVFLPLSVEFTIRSRRFGPGTRLAQRIKGLATVMIPLSISIVGGGKTQVYFIDDLLDSIPVKVNVSRPDQLPPRRLWPLQYFKLLDEVEAPSAQLPKSWFAMVDRKLRRLGQTSDGKLVKRCGLYLRRKGIGEADLTSANRTGSPLDHYLPAVRYLNSVGYQVLLTGDATLTATEFEAFRGGLVDARHAGVDNGIFSLFAGFEVDIFIGEAGGGSWLPILKNVPSLMTNAFPYLFGLPNSWIYYKTARDSSGRLVHYADLWKERAYDYELAGLTIEENTAEQILEAVTEFVLAVAHGDSPGPSAISQPPDNIWMAHAANCAVSPAFARLFESSAVEPAIASK